jgi:hypothetical protein
MGWIEVTSRPPGSWEDVGVDGCIPCHQIHLHRLTYQYVNYECWYAENSPYAKIIRGKTRARSDAADWCTANNRMLVETRMIKQVPAISHWTSGVPFSIQGYNQNKVLVGEYAAPFDGSRYTIYNYFCDVYYRNF